jgi:hypothetical protein
MAEHGAVNGIITKLTFRFMLLKRAYTKANSKVDFSDKVPRNRDSKDLTGRECSLKDREADKPA